MVVEQLRRIRHGWSVVGADGSEVGAVEEVHDDYVLVKAGALLKHNLYVPVDAVSGVSDETLTLNVSSGDVADLGWRFPPDRGFVREGEMEKTDAGSDLTTMTGAGYGTGTGPAAAGPFAPGHGDAIEDRMGGSARAGLSGLSSRPEDDLAPVATGDELVSGDDLASSDAAGDEADTGDDTSDDTSEDTSTDTSDVEGPDQLV